MKLTEPGKGTLTNSDLQKVAVTFEPISPNVSSFRRGKAGPILRNRQASSK
jgi:hypothetical protein